MRKPSKRLPLLLLLLLLLMLVSSQLAIVYASPGALYQTSPTSETEAYYAGSIVSGAWTDARDWNNSTYVSFVYSSTGNGLIGIVKFTPFSILSLPWRIVQVDFKMKYNTTINTKGGTYEIYYKVGASSKVTLVAPTNDVHNVTTSPYCDTWYSKAEPNDGVWSWTDISNIEFTVESPFTRRETGTFNLYEAWVTVHYRVATLYVDPTTQTVGAPFTVDINITNVEDLYSWEFNVTYDTSKLTATAVTEGPFLKSAVPPGNTTFGNMISDANGWVYAYCTIIGDQAGVTGSGDLATISFSIDATGTSIPIDFNNKTKIIEYDFVSKNNYTFLSDKTLCLYPPYYVIDVDGSVTTTAVPEFPLGGAIEIALAAAVIFVWWKRKQKTKPHIFLPQTT